MEIYPVKTYQLNANDHKQIKNQTAEFYLTHRLDNYTEKQIANLMGLSVNELYRFKAEWQLDNVRDFKGMKERLNAIKSAQKRNIPHWEHKKPDLNHKE